MEGLTKPHLNRLPITYNFTEASLPGCSHPPLSLLHPPTCTLPHPPTPVNHPTIHPPTTVEGAVATAAEVDVQPPRCPRLSRLASTPAPRLSPSRSAHHRPLHNDKHHPPHPRRRPGHVSTKSSSAVPTLSTLSPTATSATPRSPTSSQHPPAMSTDPGHFGQHSAADLLRQSLTHG